MIERIYDAETDTTVEVPLDKNKIKVIEQYNKLTDEKLAKQQEREERRQSALAKLIDLGLTEEEIAAL